MEVYILRHGQSEANIIRMHAGWGSTPLSEKGRCQARKAEKYLSTIKFDKVIVSDLLRTKQTAELAIPGYDYQLDSRIREIDSGILMGKKVSECMETFGEPYKKSLKELDYTLYGGENNDMLAKRIEDFMRELEQAKYINSLERIAVVSHEGAICHMIGYALGSKLSISKLQITNCSVTKLEYVHDKWQLCFILPIEMICN